MYSNEKYYIIVDLDFGELRGNCMTKKEVIKEAQEYCDFCYSGDDDYKQRIPQNWEDALGFFKGEGMMVFCIDNREK